MSTILDALKKSEQERKLTSLPTLNDMPTPVEQSPWPLRIVIALLLAVLLLLLWFGVRWNLEPNTTISGQAKNIVLNNETVAAQTIIGSDQDATTIVVNVVSYADQPEQRFVMINGKMFREGEFIEPGLKVDKIKENSVVLNQRGQRIERKP